MFLQEAEQRRIRPPKPLKFFRRRRNERGPRHRLARLVALGLPVPGDVRVRQHPHAGLERAAQDIGLPVVIKPSDGNHGRGVTLDISNEADCEAAFKLADAEAAAIKVAGDAVAMATSGEAAATFLLDGPPVSAVTRVAAAGEVMPQKSTYFDPKAPTGLLFGPLDW